MRGDGLRLVTVTAMTTAMLTAVPGCGGQVGEETFMCDVVSRTPLALDEQTPLGFAARQVLDATMGEHPAVLVWAGGDETDATFELAYVDGSAEFLEREWVDDGSGAELAPFDCADVVRFRVRLDASTTDGALAESWELEADAAVAGELTLTHLLSSLSGSLDITAFAPEGDFDGMRAWLNLRVDAGGVTGAISGQAEGSDGEVAYAEGYDIAVIGPPAE
jgi:hypothetical protein